MSILSRIGKDQNPQDPNNQGKDQNGGTQRPTPIVPQRRITTPDRTTNDTYQDLKTRVQNKLISTIDTSVDVTKIAEVRRTIQELFEQILSEENIVLSRP